MMRKDGRGPKGRFWMVAGIGWMILAAFPAAAGVEGRWKAESEAGDQVAMHLRYTTADSRGNLTWSAPVREFPGLGPEAFRSSGEPLRFRWVRDAGILAFEGESGRRPSGTFTFEPDAGFVAALRDLGYRGLEEENIFRLLVDDVSLEYARGVAAAGYGGLECVELARFRIHGIEIRWIEAMQELGYRPAAEDLIRLRVHGDRAD
ncbi:MAG: hypothetical protein PVF68_13925, partial [Acidobacteriota bacterium]